jgi:hypothetical protein
VGGDGGKLVARSASFLVMRSQDVSHLGPAWTYEGLPETGVAFFLRLCGGTYALAGSSVILPLRFLRGF